MCGENNNRICFRITTVWSIYLYCKYTRTITEFNWTKGRRRRLLCNRCEIKVCSLESFKTNGVKKCPSFLHSNDVCLHTTHNEWLFMLVLKWLNPKKEHKTIAKRNGRIWAFRLRTSWVFRQNHVTPHSLASCRNLSR